MHTFECAKQLSTKQLLHSHRLCTPLLFHSLQPLLHWESKVYIQKETRLCLHWRSRIKDICHTRGSSVRQKIGQDSFHGGCQGQPALTGTRICPCKHALSEGRGLSAWRHHFGQVIGISSAGFSFIGISSSCANSLRPGGSAALYTHSGFRCSGAWASRGPSEPSNGGKGRAHSDVCSLTPVLELTRFFEQPFDFRVIGLKAHQPQLALTL